MKDFELTKAQEEILRAQVTEERMAAHTRCGEDRESVVPDAEQPRTVEELARAWNAIGQRVADEDASLSTDPDDYPLFGDSLTKGPSE